MDSNIVSFIWIIRFTYTGGRMINNRVETKSCIEYEIQVSRIFYKRTSHFTDRQVITLTDKAYIYE